MKKEETNICLGATTAGPRTWLRLEGLCYLVAGAYFYSHQDYSWQLFATLFFAPDLSFLGYLLGPRVGAYCYNAAHSLVGPILLALLGLTLLSPLWVALATIWVCHVGFDRALGFGLKYNDDFKHTHLGFPRVTLK